MTVAPIGGRKKVAVVRDKRRSEKKDRIMAFLSEEDFVLRRLKQPFLTSFEARLINEISTPPFLLLLQPRCL